MTRFVSDVAGRCRKLFGREAQERRRHSRVPISLLGRYMLPNFREYPARRVMCRRVASRWLLR